jgi:hypothetical protein
MIKFYQYLTLPGSADRLYVVGKKCQRHEISVEKKFNVSLKVL